MDQRVVIAAAGVLLGMMAWQAYRNTTAVTAGDEEADIFSDTVDELKSTFTGWPSGSEPYQAIIIPAGQDNGVPISILAWLLWKESRYNPAIINGTKRSSVGAMGIAQFMPATARDEGIDPLDPAQAIPAAASYLARLYRSTGTWGAALAAYNWGIGNVQRKGLAAAPAETRDYYTTILSKAGYEATA
ncbi:MAG: lytic transglycosylase domain-containing protein [Telluria sp.]